VLSIGILGIIVGVFLRGFSVIIDGLRTLALLNAPLTNYLPAYIVDLAFLLVVLALLFAWLDKHLSLRVKIAYATGICAFLIPLFIN